ncbi:uncharacterized protein LOC124666723 isoform X4 [Lolium rigidum]|uniref:uncharacterized protein LOC124666723 isoform X4 n=1 Tax=Lolium rigidum TaxID=89674 RepID=UPI001F5CF10D|nr:uncharacterized protein LOC124666723 isoform X4 [Lolium rigidum]
MYKGNFGEDQGQEQSDHVAGQEQSDHVAGKVIYIHVLFREMGHVWIEEVKKLAYWQYINFKQQGRSKMDIRLGLYSGIASAMLSHARRYTGGIHRGQSDPWQGVNTSDLAISLPSRADTSILCCGYII